MKINEYEITKSTLTVDGEECNFLKLTPLALKPNSETLFLVPNNGQIITSDDIVEYRNNSKNFNNVLITVNIGEKTIETGKKVLKKIKDMHGVIKFVLIDFEQKTNETKNGVEKKKFFSPILCRAVTSHLKLPKDFDPKKEYKLLFVHDAHNMFFDEDASFGQSWRLLEALEKTGTDNEFIVYGFDCNNHSEGVRRASEYSAWKMCKQVAKDFPKYANYANAGGDGKEYIDFVDKMLGEELYPAFNISRAYTLGSSMGGVIGLYLLLSNLDKFKGGACVSNAFWFNVKDIVRFVQESSFDHIDKLWLDVGNEEWIVNTDEAQLYLNSNKKVVDEIFAKTKNAKYKVYSGGKHNEESWRARLPEILEYLSEN